MIEEIWDKIVEFNDSYVKNWRKKEMIFLSNALAGEVGELCNLVKKHYGGGTNREEVTVKRLMFEAADILVYLVMFSEILGVDEEAFRNYVFEKLKVLEERMGKK